MAWTDTTRAQHARAGWLSKRFDRCGMGGDRAAASAGAAAEAAAQTTDLRGVVEAILYLAGERLPWRMLPPAFRRSRRCGASSTCGATWAVADDQPPLVMAAREPGPRGLAQRRRSSTARASKPPKAAGFRGYDAGKKIKGRKRHIVTDTVGLMLVVARPRRRHPGPRRRADRRSRRSATASPGCAISSPTAAMPATSWRPRWRSSASGPSRSSSVRCRQGLRSPAPPLGGRTHLRMARSLPPPRQGLRALDRKLAAWALIAHIRRLTRLIARHCSET